MTNSEKHDEGDESRAEEHGVKERREEKNKEENYKENSGQEIKRLLEIMTTLRGEDGCPWDKKQTIQSLRPYVIEESYEVVEAIEREDRNMLREELGDLLLQVIFQAHIAREEGDFNFAEVVRDLNEKIIRRHPHVFSDARADNPEEVRKTWRRIKREEKKVNEKDFFDNEKKEISDEIGDGSILSDFSRSQPALLQAREIQEKAAEAGFDWDNIEPVLDKVEEEVAELREAVENNRPREVLEGELGDSLFALVNLARFLSLDPELALVSCLNRFRERFEYIERRANESSEGLKSYSLKQLDEWWEEAKSKFEREK